MTTTTNMTTLSTQKTTLLNLETMCSLDFVTLRKQIINKKFTNDVNNFLSDLFKLYSNTMTVDMKSTKLFLSAYVLMNHRTEVTTEDNYSIKLGNCATEVLQFLEDLFTSKLTLDLYNKFVRSFKNYVNFFQLWQERDSLLLARPSINTYLNIDMQIEALEDTEKISDLKRVQKRLRCNIKMIAGNKGLEFLDKKEMPYFKDESIFQEVEKTVRKAFWDVFSENMKNNKYEQLGLLLEDVKQFILELVPNNKAMINDVNEHLDIPFINNMIENNLLTDEGIFTYIKYIINHVQRMQAAADDKDTELFLENLEQQFARGNERHVILRYFFKTIFEKLEKIKKVTMLIREELKNNKK